MLLATCPARPPCSAAQSNVMQKFTYLIFAAGQVGSDPVSAWTVSIWTKKTLTFTLFLFFFKTNNVTTLKSVLDISSLHSSSSHGSYQPGSSVGAGVVAPSSDRTPGSVSGSTNNEQTLKSLQKHYMNAITSLNPQLPINVSPFLLQYHRFLFISGRLN